MYLRLIERTESYGQYKKTIYLAQSFISRRTAEETTLKTDIKWTDYRFYDFDKDISTRELAELYFHKQTLKKKFTWTDKAI